MWELVIIPKHQRLRWSLHSCVQFNHLCIFVIHCLVVEHFFFFAFSLFLLLFCPWLKEEKKWKENLKIVWSHFCPLILLSSHSIKVSRFLSLRSILPIIPWLSFNFFFLSLNFDTCPQSWGPEEMHVVRWWLPVSFKVKRKREEGCLEVIMWSNLTVLTWPPCYGTCFLCAKISQCQIASGWF